MHEDQLDESVTSKESSRLSVKSGNGLDTDEEEIIIDNFGSVEMMEWAYTYKRALSVTAASLPYIYYREGRGEMEKGHPLVCREVA